MKKILFLMVLTTQVHAHLMDNITKAGTVKIQWLVDSLDSNGAGLSVQYKQYLFQQLKAHKNEWLDEMSIGLKAQDFDYVHLSEPVLDLIKPFITKNSMFPLVLLRAAIKKTDFDAVYSLLQGFPNIDLNTIGKNDGKTVLMHAKESRERVPSYDFERIERANMILRNLIMHGAREEQQDDASESGDDVPALEDYVDSFEAA